MAKTDVKLYAIDNYGKATTATVSDVNPDATSSQLVQMGHLLNNLTQNTYSKTDRINTINCDTEGGSGKLTPTLTLEQSSCSVDDIRAKLSIDSVWVSTITTDSDGDFYIKLDSSIIYPNNAYVSILHLTNGLTRFGIRAIQDVLPAAQTIIIGQAETDTYEAAEVTFTITA